MKLWEEMTHADIVEFLFAEVLHSPVPANTQLSLDLLARCEMRLNQKQRRDYISYVSSHVAAITYNGLTDAQIQLPETTDDFYFNVLTLSAEQRAKNIWHVIKNYAP